MKPTKAVTLQVTPTKVQTRVEHGTFGTDSLRFDPPALGVLFEMVMFGTLRRAVLDDVAT